MNNKYFVPEIEDLYIGYECEYKHNCTNCVDISWKPIIINQDFLAGGYSESNYYGDEFLRTPFLTKEQIEKEDWKFIGEAVDIWFEKEGEFDRTSWTSYKSRLHYN